MIFRSSKNRQKAQLTTGWSRNCQNTMTESQSSDTTVELVAQNSTLLRRLKNSWKTTIWEHEKSRRSLKMNGGTKIRTIIHFLMFESEFFSFNLFLFCLSELQKCCEKKIIKSQKLFIILKESGFLYLQLIDHFSTRVKQIYHPRKQFWFKWIHSASQLFTNSAKLSFPS